jgi:hypothetical protein
LCIRNRFKDRFIPFGRDVKFGLGLGQLNCMSPRINKQGERHRKHVKKPDWATSKTHHDSVDIYRW